MSGIYGEDIYGGAPTTIIAKDFVELRDPALFAAAGARIDGLVTLAKEYFSASALGKNYEKATGLLVLHWLTLEKIGGTTGAGTVAGAVTHEKEGELSRSIGSIGSSSSKDLFPFLGSTSYGRELDGLIRGSVIAFGVTGPGVLPSALSVL